MKYKWIFPVFASTEIFDIVFSEQRHDFFACCILNVHIHYLKEKQFHVSNLYSLSEIYSYIILYNLYIRLIFKIKITFTAKGSSDLNKFRKVLKLYIYCRINENGFHIIKHNFDGAISVKII